MGKKFGFSPKRALGISSAKSKIAKRTGIPTTKQGRRNKARRLATGGCLTLIIEIIGIIAIIAVALFY